MSKSLPTSPRLEQLRKQAKELVKAHRSRDLAADARLGEFLPRLANLSPVQILDAPFALHDAQHVVAREHGFASWPRLKQHVDGLELDRSHDADTNRVTSLFKAIEVGNVATVAAIIQEHPELLKARYGKFLHEPLHHAASCNRPEVAEALVAAGADIHSLGGWPGTPLEIALCDAKREVAVVLANHGITPMTLRVVASLGRLDLVQEFFDVVGRLRADREIPRNFYYKDGKPDPDARPAEPQELINDAFHWATVNGQLETVEFLLNYGADVDYADGLNGGTALHWAAWHGWKELAVRLIERGARVYVLDPEYRGVPWGWAAQAGHTDVRDAILEAASRTDIFAAVAYGREDRVVALLEQFPEQVNRQEPSGTPLHEAVAQGNTDVAELLLAHGADPNLTDERGQTALSKAIQAKHTALAEVLHRHGGEEEVDLARFAPQDCFTSVRLGLVEQVRHHLASGADPNLAEASGETVLAAAVSARQPEIVSLLLRAGAVMDLASAAELGDIEQMKALVTQGAGIDEADFAKYENTPLHRPVQGDAIEAVRYLLEHGADVERTNRHNATPLDTALQSGASRALIELLLYHGADASHRPDSGKTPLEVARDAGRDDIALLLEQHGGEVRVETTPT